MSVENDGNGSGGNNEESMAQAAAESVIRRQPHSQDAALRPPLGPGEQGREHIGLTQIEFRFLNFRREKEFQDLAEIFRDESVVEHIGPLRADLEEKNADYTAEDVRGQFNRNRNLHPIVAVDASGRVIGTITVEVPAPQLTVGRLRLWAVHPEYQHAGIGPELVQRAQAYIFAPRAESGGGLDCEMIETGVIVGLSKDQGKTPTAQRILQDMGFHPQEGPQPRVRGGWDLGKKDFVPRLLQQMVKYRKEFLTNNWDETGSRRVRRRTMMADLTALGTPPRR